LVLAAVPDHVLARPGLETWNPNVSFAMTFSHGAGGRLAGTQDRDVLATAVGEAAEPIEELEFGARRRRVDPGGGRRAAAGAGGGAAARRSSRRMTWSLNFPAAQEDGPCAPGGACVVAES